ncbi:hypothetical protein Dda_5043 [Drechslerella dactyloides]|uniref:F-box domain-containing protein n=1 Tax=Drechslerella dactyloides TaxID=74499 RepID=A0AAD6NJU2_DREDA|nr:hypothetical protein Dda_5043 [Drechslerella dactyloides]
MSAGAPSSKTHFASALAHPSSRGAKSHNVVHSAIFDMGNYLNLTNKITICTPSKLARDIKRRLRNLGSSIGRLTTKLVTARLPTASASPPLKTGDAPLIAAPDGPCVDHPPAGTTPIASLSDVLLIRIFQQLGYEQLRVLLSVNRRCRKLLLDNYHLILSYPAIITSRYEYCLLTPVFPESWDDKRSAQFYTALHRVAKHENCFRLAADMLTDGYIRSWGILAMKNPRLRDMFKHITQVRGWEGVREEILARLLNEAWRRGVRNDDAIKYMEQLVPLDCKQIAFMEISERDENKRKGTASPFIKSRDTVEYDDATSSDTDAPPPPPDVLQEAIAYAIDRILREEISYNFPSVRLERLHPVQILELMRVKVAPWSWKQEDQADQMRRVFVGSVKAAEQLEMYREEWETMKESVAATLGTQIL